MIAACSRGGYAVEHFVAAREPFRVHNQRQNQLQTVRTVIPRIAPPHHRVGLGGALDVGAGQVIQHHIELRLKQLTIALLQMLL
jgi:hypothetical protein